MVIENNPKELAAMKKFPRRRQGGRTAAAGGSLRQNSGMSIRKRTIVPARRPAATMETARNVWRSIGLTRSTCLTACVLC